MFKRVFKRKAKIKIGTETIVKTVALLKAAQREMMWFEIENEGQQRIRDYLVEQIEILLGELRKEYQGLD